jgi:glycerophosphoryl diester phosphodiesterase
MKFILSFIMLAVLAWDSPKKAAVSTMKAMNIYDSLPVFDKEGHRGCRGLMPENTIPAMLKALDLGVSTLEMDTHITKDRMVIISHDPYFNHDITTKPDGKYLAPGDEKKLLLYGMNYSETQQYDVGLKPHPHFPRQEKIPVHKPLLRDLIDSVENYCVRKQIHLPFYNIETKSTPATDHINHPPPEEFVDLLMAVILSKHIENRTIIQSFDPRTLQVLHRKYPGVMTALLIERLNRSPIDDQLKQLGFIPTIYSPEYTLVTDSLLIKCHAANMKIIPWTVDDKINIERLKKMGVDGIITDYPDLFEQ